MSADCAGFGAWLPDKNPTIPNPKGSVNECRLLTQSISLADLYKFTHAKLIRTDHWNSSPTWGEELMGMEGGLADLGRGACGCNRMWRREGEGIEGMDKALEWVRGLRPGRRWGIGEEEALE
ncbi:hypothetical protein MRB53_015170 [Persea americana]|uniref:Uncharacterized protein n=1 Tax=Persea americana TaxID=3435 RepID=A0ACC2KCW1_PERAE|nr:hypothetical protein MRB53_015170 [Persea americana]